MNMDDEGASICEKCSAQFWDGVEELYPLCLECSCDNTQDLGGNLFACYYEKGHSGACAYTFDDYQFSEPSDIEVAEAVASIQQAVPHV
jgi:hypothetical protein